MTVFILLKGVKRVIKSQPRKITLTKLKAGVVYGEIAYVDKQPTTKSVMADGDVIAVKIFLNKLDEFPLKTKD